MPLGTGIRYYPLSMTIAGSIARWEPVAVLALSAGALHCAGGSSDPSPPAVATSGNEPGGAAAGEVEPEPVATGAGASPVGAGDGVAPPLGSGTGNGANGDGVNVVGLDGAAGSGASSDEGNGPGTTEPMSAPRTVSWESRTLSTLHVAEGADAGDIDGDGVLDLVAGPIWYKGPDFAVGGTLFANPPSFPRDQYSTFFLTFVDDVDQDGRPDVLGIGDAGGANGSGNPNSFWYRNPGPGALDQAWTKTPLFDGLIGNESPAFVDLLGDARRELVFMANSQLGFARPGAGAASPWSFSAVSAGVNFPNYTHGLGVGDVDGDGLSDITERSGWWRQVPGAAWERHAFNFWLGSTAGRANNWGGSEMYVYDVDGDADNDVVSVLAAHQYGLAWFEHVGTGAEATFTAHPILGTAAGMGNTSQLHSLAVADVNGDGLTDLVSGKRYYAHPSTNPDPGTNDAPLLVWFELQRGAAGAEFVQHVIHSDSGAGCNFVVRDLNGDGKVDVFTTNKRGTFLHLQR